MQESNSDNADSLCSLTAGSAAPTSGLQGSFSYRQVSLLVKNVTSNIWTFPDIHEREKKSKFHTLKYEQDFFFLLQMA